MPGKGAPSRDTLTTWSGGTWKGTDAGIIPAFTGKGRYIKHLPLIFLELLDQVSHGRKIDGGFAWQAFEVSDTARWVLPVGVDITETPLLFD